MYIYIFMYIHVYASSWSRPCFFCTSLVMYSLCAFPMLTDRSKTWIESRLRTRTWLHLNLFIHIHIHIHIYIYIYICYIYIYIYVGTSTCIYCLCCFLIFGACEPNIRKARKQAGRQAGSQASACRQARGLA